MGSLSIYRAIEIEILKRDTAQGDGGPNPVACRFCFLFYFILRCICFKLSFTESNYILFLISWQTEVIFI